MNGLSFETNFEWARELPEAEWIEFLAGVRKIPGHFAPVMPPPGLQRQFVGAEGIEAFQQAARFCRHMRAVLSGANAAWTPQSQVLDLGVGWGRFYRLLLREPVSKGLIGADIDPKMIEICRYAMPGGRFVQNPVEPPYEFPSESCDAIFLYSVFSHLAERSVLQLLDEFARLLKPGGFVFFTTLRAAHLAVWARQANEKGTEMAKQLERAGFDLADWTRKLEKGSLLFLPTGGGDVRAGSFYGQTILTKEFFRKSGAERDFEIVRFDEPADLPQAFGALRKRGFLWKIGSKGDSMAWDTSIQEETPVLMSIDPGHEGEENLTGEKRLKWHDGGLRLGKFEFIFELGANIATAAAEYPKFILMKTRKCIDDYLEVLPRRQHYSDVLELGIMKGGSCVFFNELLAPARHMAVDIRQHKTGLPEFADYVRGQERQFLARNDIGQDDGAKIVSIYEQTFGVKAEFDLVIDDASHNYALSLESFNALFPRVKPGGIYALEDWGWAHWPGRFQEKSDPEYNNPALSNLAIHIVLAVTGAGGIIAEAIVKPNTIFAIRGPAPAPAGFRIENAVLRRDRPLPYY